ncbi:unnamed protein product, partial [Choristocarpus tenellus]
GTPIRRLQVYNLINRFASIRDIVMLNNSATKWAVDATLLHHRRMEGFGTKAADEEYMEKCLNRCFTQAWTNSLFQDPVESWVRVGQLHRLAIIPEHNMLPSIADR